VVDLMENICLKKMREEDLPLVLEWRNKPYIREASYNNSVISWEQHKLWFDKCQLQGDKENFICFYNNKPIGVVNLFNIDYMNKTCSWSIYKGENENTKGLGELMGRCALDYIFKVLKMRKVYVDVLGNNLISKCFHEKLGFKLEGTFIKQILRGDDEIDVFRLAAFKPC
jgi:UDP-4-amino-4,6-dideoxy-N-acetyl-beta-L-altrosamine N-acetyltransferase